MWHVGHSALNTQHTSGQGRRQYIGPEDPKNTEKYPEWPGGYHRGAAKNDVNHKGTEDI